MPEAVIVAAARSPIGRAQKGSLASVRPDDLAETTIAAALDQVPELVPSTVEDLLLGCAEPHDKQGGNLARRIAVQLGLDSVPGTTVNRFCSSSVQTRGLAFHAIKAGEGDVLISAGVECVSRYRSFAGAGAEAEDVINPRFADARELTAKYAATNEPWTDPRARGLLPDIYINMGQTAEHIATLRGISRYEQDEFAVRSQLLASQARDNGFFDHEITPIQLADGTLVTHDDGPRPGTTIEKLSGLQPVFRTNGTVTAGNCCPLNDGAAAVIIMSESRARELGITPLARIVSTAISGLSPEVMGLGPVEATRAALSRAGMQVSDVDLFEINEAFAAQVIASYQELASTRPLSTCTAVPSHWATLRHDRRPNHDHPAQRTTRHRRPDRCRNHVRRRAAKAWPSSSKALADPTEKRHAT